MHRAATGHGEPAALLSPQECLEKIRDKIQSPKICGTAALPERCGSPSYTVGYTVWKPGTFMSISQNSSSTT